MDYRVEQQAEGKTVLEIIRRELGISSALMRHLKFSEGGILVNGEHATVRYVLHTGDVLSLAVEDRASGEKLTPIPLSLAIAYEDDDVVIPNKPSDMPTHPSCGHYEDTVANALAYRYDTAGIPFVFRPVNRLDRNTSGLLAIARNRIAAATLTRAMQNGEIRKRYVAVLDGVPNAESGLIETYMRRTAASVIVRENCGPDEGGDEARTQYRVFCQKDGHALVGVVPLTGRTHQIRVHFAGLGCPLVGEDLYGTPSDRIGRHALHSAELGFPRPSDGKRVTVWAPLPDDMRRLVEQIFGTEQLCAVREKLLAEQDALANCF